MGRVLVGIIAIFFLIGGASGAILSGIDTWRTDGTTITDVYANTTTGAGIVSANVTLTEDLYKATVGQVISVSSNNTETPVASAYNESTLVLNITGLNAAQTRTLTVNYYGETDDPVLLGLGPFLSFLLIGGLCGLIFWGMFSSRRKRG